MHPLDDPKLQAVLAREHGRAEGDGAKLAEVRDQIDEVKKVNPDFDAYAHLYPKDVYLSISADMGRFLTLTAESIGAKRVVEYGTSFAISTLYLAAGVRARGGVVIGSERERNKVAQARSNIAEAGFDDIVEVREGDARETLATVDAPVDLLFLDGWKGLYVEVLKLLEPKLRPGALVLADNIATFPEALEAYVAYVSRPEGPYLTTILPFDSGLGYSIYKPD